LDGGSRRIVGHHPFQLQEGADSLHLIQAQRNITVPAAPAGLRYPHRRPVAHAQDRLVHLLTVQYLGFMLQAVLGIGARPLEGEPMTAAHRSQPQESHTQFAIAERPAQWRISLIILDSRASEAHTSLGEHGLRRPRIG